MPNLWITPVNNLDQQKQQGVLRMSDHPSLKSFSHKYFRQNYHSLARISLILSSPVNPSGDTWKVKCLVNLTRSTTFWIRSFIYIYIYYIFIYLICLYIIYKAGCEQPKDFEVKHETMQINQTLQEVYIAPSWFSNPSLVSRDWTNHKSNHSAINENQSWSMIYIYIHIMYIYAQLHLVCAYICGLHTFIHSVYLHFMHNVHCTWTNFSCLSTAAKSRQTTGISRFPHKVCPRLDSTRTSPLPRKSKAKRVRWFQSVWKDTDSVIALMTVGGRKHVLLYVALSISTLGMLIRSDII